MDDPRLTPARPDLAAKYLEGKVTAARFVAGEEFEIADALAPLREAPAPNALLHTQALKGERVTIYDRNGEGFAWGQLNSDGYVGWLPDAALAKPAARRQSHGVADVCVSGRPIKLPPVETLSMGASVTVKHDDGASAVTREGWYTRVGISAAWSQEDDFVALLVGMPYLGAAKQPWYHCPACADFANAAGWAVRATRHAAGRLPGTQRCGSEKQRGDLIF
jgi:hypothetical protein